MCLRPLTQNRHALNASGGSKSLARSSLARTETLSGTPDGTAPSAHGSPSGLVPKSVTLVCCNDSCSHKEVVAWDAIHATRQGRSATTRLPLRKTGKACTECEFGRMDWDGKTVIYERRRLVDLYNDINMRPNAPGRRLVE